MVLCTGSKQNASKHTHMISLGILEEEYIQSLATPSKPPLSAIPSKVLIPPYVPHQHRGVLRVDQMYDNMGNKIFSHSK